MSESLNYKLIIIAWYIFLRSGCIQKDESGTFTTSYWAKTVLFNLTKFVLKFDGMNFKLNGEEKKIYSSINNYYLEESYDELDYMFDDYMNEIQFERNNSIPKEIFCAYDLLNGENIDKIVKNETDNKILLLNNYPINKYLDISILDELWREYILLNNRIYSAVCGDASNIVLDEVIHVLQKHVNILCYKVQPLTLAGKKQWVRLQYAHESHWDERNFTGYMYHPGAYGDRMPGNKVGVLFFQKKNYKDNIRKLKKQIRIDLNNTYKRRSGLHYPHIHFPDTHLETKWIANAIYNKNTINWMNNSIDNYPNKFSILIQEYQKEMLLRDDNFCFCLDTGSVMALYGLRDTSDLDYISIGDSEKPIVNSHIDSHNTQYKNYKKKIHDLIENPNHHFFYKNMKFLTLDEVKNFKTYRINEFSHSPSVKKDINDINKINNYLNQINKKFNKDNKNLIKPDYFQNNLKIKKEKINLIYKQIYLFIKKKIPSKLINFLKNKYLKIKKYHKNKIRKKIPNTLG